MLIRIIFFITLLLHGFGDDRNDMCLGTTNCKCQSADTVEVSMLIWGVALIAGIATFCALFPSESLSNSSPTGQ
ncbi:MAG: hypothetical protein KGI80_00320 [Verrucomicrobiota bacterium]|nr:hypothetical protein [Verrucomicrobiota bacterium]